jgi:NAD(P)H-dependent flavin oxidoreductase YrpB (nitropropane dioxygenase family)
MDHRILELWRSELPIQLAPMGSVSATPRLALAVAAAGGHAMYPALALPPAALAPAVDALAEAAAAFGVNFIVPVMDPASLELAVERAPYVDFFLQDPDPALVERVHATGALCGWQIETAEEARAAEAAGCDVVIAKAWESGGRKRLEGATLLPLLDGVLDAVSIPVVAAGGIATARGVAAALAAGAAGVRVGTRFIASAESDAHPDWIAAVLEASATDAVVSDAYNVGLVPPGPHRVLQSALDAAAALPEERPAATLRVAGAEVPVPRFGPQPPTRDTTGEIAAMALYAGQSAGAVRATLPAAEIVAELARGVPERPLHRTPRGD